MTLRPPVRRRGAAEPETSAETRPGADADAGPGGGRPARERYRRALVTVAVILIAVVAAVVVVSAGNDDKSGSGGARSHAATATGPSSTIPSTPAARRALARMALPRQVAQLFAVGFDGHTAGSAVLGPLRAHGWGAIVLDRRNFAGRSQLARLTRQLRAAMRTSRLPAPLVGAAQIGGASTAFPGMPPEPPSSTGASGQPARAAAQATAAARALRAAGLDMTLAPVADVGTPAGAVESQVYADDPATVTGMVRAAVAAYARAGVVSAIGHFPGQGTVSQDPQAGPTSVGLSVPALARRDLRPFAAVARRVPVVIVSNAAYAAYDGVTPAVLLPRVVSGLLRRDLHFDGVIMSDDLLGTQAANGGSLGAAAVGALEAGADLVYLSGDGAAQHRAYRAVLAAVRRGKISRAQVRASALRVLSLRGGRG